MKETLVSGARGFLGTHLTEKLDNFTTIPHANLQGDLPHFDRFFFLSTFGNMSFHHDENQIVKANILDLVNVLRQTPWDTLDSFVFVSSSSVKREIQTFYSRTKKAAEEILLSYMEKYNAPICIVRPLSITGVGDQPEHFIPTLIRSCIDGEEMPFVADAYHDYIDVDDVVSGMITLSNQRAKGIFELGRGESRSNREVKELVEKITGKKANTRPTPTMRSYDSREWVSTNFRAWQMRWSPLRTLEQSVTEMVDDYVKN